MGNIVIRTVLDLRQRMPKYQLQTMLLAASWHRYAAAEAPLEVFCVGSLSPNLLDFFQELGVRVKHVPPNQNDSFSKTSNTIQGASPASGKRLLLVDNDVVFTGVPTELSHLDEKTVFGAIAGNSKVKPAQWRFMADRHFKPQPASPEVPRTQLVGALAVGKPAPPALEFSYVNGGVVHFPEGFDFQTTWQNTQREIAEAFQGHVLDRDSIRKSNMAALAVTIGTYGAFDWLPYGYNVRHADIALGLCTPDAIKLVHMTGLGKRTDATTLNCWVKEYWVQKMLKGLERLQHTLPEDEFQRRYEGAMTILSVVLDVVHAYKLDPLAQMLISENDGALR